MHSHDRTMLSSLGFTDRDKQNPKHDLACQYLALPENAGRLAKVMFAPVAETYEVGPSAEALIEKSVCTVWPGALSQVAFEHPIRKGEGQYRTTIGFQDLVLAFCRNERWTERFSRNDCLAEFRPVPDREVIDEPRSSGRFIVRVEVKASESKVSDALRQINLYREYLPDSTYSEKCGWVLATCYDVHPADVAQLKNERIKHVRLGAGFEKFCAERERSPTQSADTEEI